jgi:DNA modification methylase
VCCDIAPVTYFGLRDYGIAQQIGLEPTPEAYVAALVAVFRDVRRVLKDDGVCWLNLGDSYAGSGKARGSGGCGPTSQKQTTNRGAYFQSEQPIEFDGFKAKDLLMIPARVALALQADGWYLRSDIIWSKPNPMPESVTDRPTKAHEYLFLLTKSARYFYDAQAIAERSTTGDIRRPYTSEGAWQMDGRPKEQRHGGKPREIYKGQATKEYDAAGAQNPSDTKRRILDAMADPEYVGRNKRSVWTIPTMPFPGAHFATMPEKLVEPCILAGSRFGDLVFDPFSGSGTVLAVAQRLGRRAVGTDLNPAYHQLAKVRTAQRGLRW